MRPAHEQGVEPLIWARRKPNDWRQAAYRLSDVSGLHSDDFSGGSGLSRASNLYGYVRCDLLQDGDRLHPCRESDATHQIKICIVRKDNADVFDWLWEQCAPAEPARAEPPSAPRLKVVGGRG
jgi:hypothetical protein